jgi:hypothetical protein
VTGMGNGNGNRVRPRVAERDAFEGRNGDRRRVRSPPPSERDRIADNKRFKTDAHGDGPASRPYPAPRGDVGITRTFSSCIFRRGVDVGVGVGVGGGVAFDQLARPIARGWLVFSLGESSKGILLVIVREVPC